ncbi:MAG: 50S ribosomal protein L9 [Erysipelotrichaceae bacterium]|nr:50S ribosomal protein L9 [Erysipelotrichaceae bacterium]
MKVILLQDVKGVGKKNQIVEVSDGYGSNFLIPRKLAVRYSEHGVEVRDKQIQHEKDEFIRKQNEAREVKAKIESIVLEFTAPSSKDGRMMGTISEKVIVQELKDKYGIVVDKRKFVDKYPCNAFGYTRLKVELFKDVVATISVHVSEKK